MAGSEAEGARAVGSPAFIILLPAMINLPLVMTIIAHRCDSDLVTFATSNYEYDFIYHLPMFL